MEIMAVYSAWWEIARPFMAFSGIPSLLITANLETELCLVVTRYDSQHRVRTTLTSPILVSLAMSDESGLLSAQMTQPSFRNLLHFHSNILDLCCAKVKFRQDLNPSAYSCTLSTVFVRLPFSRAGLAI